MNAPNEPEWVLAWSAIEDLMNAGSFKLPTPIDGTFINFDYRSSELSLDIEIDTEAEPNLLPQVVAFRLQDVADDRKILTMACVAPDLNRSFYMFLVDVLTKMRDSHLDPVPAIESAWRTWGQLLEQQSVLSIQRQVGLIGELWLLRRFGQRLGWAKAFEMWHDEANSEHDFCLQSADIEVKSTTLEARIHTISSLHQLVPSPDRALMILSLQYTPASGLAKGAESLKASVARIRRELKDDNLELKFLNRLKLVGWNENHAAYYGKAFMFRNVPTLVPVDEFCPKITPELLERLPDNQGQRIKSVLYSIDLTSLGWPDNSERFMEVIP